MTPTLTLITTNPFAVDGTPSHPPPEVLKLSHRSAPIPHCWAGGTVPLNTRIRII